MSDIICPHCDKAIYDEDALTCHFCGESLGRTSSGGIIGAMRGAGMKWIWISIALLMLVAFVLSMF